MTIKEKNRAVASRLSQYHWHDSHVLELHALLRGEVNHMRVYDFRIDMNLIVGRSEGKYRYAFKSLLFRDCRFLSATVDFLGLAIIRGHISEFLVHEDPSELRSLQETFRNFDFPEIRIPLADCICYQLKLIHPAGQVAIWAADLEIIDTDNESKE